MSDVSAPPAPPHPPRSRTLRDELDDEPVVVPGTVRSDDVVLTWANHRVRVVRLSLPGAQRRIALGPGEIGAVQVSRARRSVDGSSRGAPADFLDVELRGGRFGRIRLSARAEDAVLEGLPWYDAPGTLVELDAARGIIAAARTLGARVTSHGADVARTPGPLEGSGGSLVSLRDEINAVRHRIGALMLHETPGAVRVDRAGYAVRSRNLALFISAMIAGVVLVFAAFSSQINAIAWLTTGAMATVAVWYARMRLVGWHRRQRFRLEIKIGPQGMLSLQNADGTLELALSDMRRFVTERSTDRHGHIVAQPCILTHDEELIPLLGADRFEEPDDCDVLCTSLNILALGQGTREDFHDVLERSQRPLPVRGMLSG